MTAQESKSAGKDPATHRRTRGRRPTLRTITHRYLLTLLIFVRLIFRLAISDPDSRASIFRSILQERLSLFSLLLIRRGRLRKRNDGSLERLVKFESWPSRLVLRGELAVLAAEEQSAAREERVVVVDVASLDIGCSNLRRRRRRWFGRGLRGSGALAQAGEVSGKRRVVQQCGDDSLGSRFQSTSGKRGVQEASAEEG